jgi:hypothetical protein
MAAEDRTPSGTPHARGCRRGRALAMVVLPPAPWPVPPVRRRPIRPILPEVPGPEPRSYRPDAAFTVDLFDYGDESIDVELPTDAVDITDPVREALESTPAARGE